jgi:hypothetical protein
MPRLTLKLVEEALRAEVRKLDKRVQIMGLDLDKKKDTYRVTLSKDGKVGTADLKKDVIKQALSQGGKRGELRKALGKAVSRLSIAFR